MLPNVTKCYKRYEMLSKRDKYYFLVKRYKFSLTGTFLAEKKPFTLRKKFKIKPNII